MQKIKGTGETDVHTWRGEKGNAGQEKPQSVTEKTSATLTMKTIIHLTYCPNTEKVCYLQDWSSSQILCFCGVCMCVWFSCCYLGFFLLIFLILTITNIAEQLFLQMFWCSRQHSFCDLSPTLDIWKHIYSHFHNPLNTHLHNLLLQIP